MFSKAHTYAAPVKLTRSKNQLSPDQAMNDLSKVHRKEKVADEPEDSLWGQCREEK